MGASRNQLETLKYHYARILGCVDNHLYYNLEHYYAILRPLPGGEKNIDNWHKMIGGKPAGLEIPYHDTRASFFASLKSMFRILLLALSKDKINQKFLARLEKIQKELETKAQKLTTSVQTSEYLSLLINRPLGFGLTVVNDVFIMFGLGYLSRKIKKLGLPETTVIDLLKTSKEVDSLLPLREIDKMVKQFSDQFILDFSSLGLNPGLDPYPEIFKQLETKNWPNEVNVLRTFIQRFGDRSFEELKLESLPLKNDPALFLKLVQWIRSQPLIEREIARTFPSLPLNWLDQKIIHFTKECIAMRESTRLWRGRFYHVIREIILRLELQLKFEDSRFHSFKLHQFFSITHHEWLQYSLKKLSFDDIAKKISERESWKTPRHYPESIIWSEEEAIPEFSPSKEHSPSLSGQGVSPGVVEGTALVLDTPETAFDTEIKDFILVTRNTDPAWVYIMSRSLGLISEKGSLLSHTAIIGRELGVPTLVGVKNATQKIPNGSRIRINGTTGSVEIL
jgi:phosphohistidine swiveling domain-containing protein